MRLDDLLPQPERDWKAPWRKKLPASLALLAARGVLQLPIRGAQRPGGTLLVAFGNLGDQLRMLNVLSRFDRPPMAVITNAEAAAAFDLFDGFQVVGTYGHHGVDALACAFERRGGFARALVPHPFVTQPFALVCARSASGSTYAAATGEYPHDARGIRFLHPARESWRRFYESFFSEALGVQPQRCAPRLRGNFACGSSPGTVVMHVGSSVAERALPDQVARALVAHVASAGYSVTLVGSNAEAAHLATIGAGHAAIVTGRALADVAQIFAQSSAFVGVDSSMMNLADAVGIPSVVLYTTTVPQVAGPFNVPLRAVRVAPPITTRVEVLTGRRSLAEPLWEGLPERVLAALGALSVKAFRLAGEESPRA